MCLPEFGRIRGRVGFFWASLIWKLKKKTTPPRGFLEETLYNKHLNYETIEEHLLQTAEITPHFPHNPSPKSRFLSAPVFANRRAEHKTEPKRTSFCGRLGLIWCSTRFTRKTNQVWRSGPPRVLHMCICDHCICGRRSWAHKTHFSFWCSTWFAG